MRYSLQELEKTSEATEDLRAFPLYSFGGLVFSGFISSGESPRRKFLKAVSVKSPCSALEVCEISLLYLESDPMFVFDLLGFFSFGPPERELG